MGRVKKYLTDDTKRNADNLASKKYYWKNKEAEDVKARLRYKLKKLGKDNELSKNL